MFVRKEQLRSAVEALVDGQSIRIVGSRGMGKSTMMDRLRSEIERYGKSSVSAAGRSGQWPEPFSAITLVLDEIPRPRSGLQLETKLTQLLQTGSKVLLLDDADFIDTGSAAVFAEACRRAGVSSAISTSLTTRSSDSPLLSSLERPVLRIDLCPLNFEQVLEMVQGLLGYEYRISSQLAARIYSKSGGIPAFVEAIVRVGRFTGQIGLIDSCWTMTGPTLWSNHLRNAVLGVLSTLPLEMGHSLQKLSWTGPVSVAQAIELVGETHLLELEVHGHIAAFGTATSGLVSVHPPIVADYFRSQERPVARTVALMSGVGGEQSSQAGHLAENVQRAQLELGQRTSAIARFFRDKSALLVETRKALWDADPTPREATAYVTTLIRRYASTKEVEFVIANTKEDPTHSLLDQWRYVLLRAEWLTFRRGNLEQAQQLLNTFAARHPEWKACAMAVSMVLASSVDSVPIDYSRQLREIEDGHPETGILSAALSYIDVLNGRPKAAIERIEASPEPESGLGRQLVGLSRSLALILQGELVQARSLALDLRNRAVSELDWVGIYVHTYTAMLAGIYLGLTGEVQQTAELVLTLGDPKFDVSPMFQAVTNISNLAAILDSRENTVGSLKLDVLNEEPYAGSLPFAQAGFGAAFDAYRMGDVEAYAAQFDHVAVDAMDRGFVIAAANAAISALIAMPTMNRYELAVQICEKCEGKAFSDLLDLSRQALESKGGHISNYEQLPVGQEYLFDLMLRSLLKQFEPDDPRYRSLTRSRDELRRIFPSIVNRGRRRTGSASRLSNREMQIALLAGSMSNLEVAQRLHLSVRTVENHISSGLRKTKSRNREELYISAIRQEPLT